MAESGTPRSPLRVLHVLDVLSLSGMEYGVIKQVNRLDPGRFAPHICCLRFQRDATRPLLSADVPVAELKRGEGWDLRLIGRLARVMREWAIDVVHSHNWQTYLYSVLAARRAGVATVIHGEHGRESTRPSSRRIRASRWLARRVAGITTVSRELERELVELWKLTPDRVTTIANGVELERFVDAPDTTPLARELGLQPDDRVVMTVGRLRPVKDHPTLLRAFARLHGEMPAARLVLLGTDFGTGVLEQLEAQARELGIAEATRFPGMRPEVPAFLALADVYVNCSVFEGMSNTILEAMAAGKPVVATSVGGNPELVHDGETGFLVPPRDDRALGERLREILTDPALAERLGARGRDHVRKRHTMERMVHRYAELYEECHCRAQLTRRERRRSVKPWLSGGVRWSGANRVRRWLGAPTLNILTYHRVLPLPQALDTPFGAMMMPRDEFEAQMAYLSRHWEVLPLVEAVRRVGDGTLPPRAVSITFDDGYRDNYEHAWPVLEKYGIPATVFIVTGAADGEVCLWWEETDETLRRLTAERIRAARFENLPEWLGRMLGRLPDLVDRKPAIRRLVDRMNGLPEAERTRILEFLRRLDGGAHTRLADLMLTWEQIREMADSGVHFGAHTVSHAFMDELDDDAARREIEGSIEALEARLGRSVSSFSFPRGRASTAARGLLRNAGIHVAVTTASGRNHAGADPLQLRRLDSGYCRAPSGFDPALFEAELLGWFHPLRGR